MAIDFDGPADREGRVRQLALAMQKLERLQECERQSSPDGGLLAFIRYFWPVLEPATPFVEGWPLECLCNHLEAITRKDTIVLNGKERRFNRFLANVPPGFMKSLTVNVFWPAWEWGPMNMPHLRYVAFSYAAELTERDNQKFRDLVLCSEYQELWGHVFKVIGDGKVRVTNDKTGFKFASSMGGVGTGERGDRVLCLAGDQNVLTERGPIPIQEIVEQKLSVRVWSLNETTRSMELRPITGWHRNPGRPLVKITTESGAQITCTQDHEIYTAQGKQVAAALGVGDALLVAPLACAGPRRQIQVQMSPQTLGPNAIDGGLAGPVLLRERQHGLEAVVDSKLIGDFVHQIVGKVRRSILPSAVALAVRNVFSPRPVFEIAKSRVASVAVFVSNLLTLWARPYKRLQHQMMDLAVADLAPPAQANPGVSVTRGRRQEYLPSQHHGAAGSGAKAIFAANATEVGYFIQPLKSGHVAPAFSRVVSVDLVHEVPRFTYCLTVDSNHNILCGVLASNCDDVHKVKGNETDDLRRSVVQWVREGMSNRLNNLRESAIVIIMQRLHEEDTSGAIMKHHADEYCHLVIPMEYERGRRLSHLPTWRTDPRKYDGELAWKDRFDTRELESFKRHQYLWSGQYQQRPSPRGGGIIKDDWWQVYEVPKSGAYDFKPIFAVASLDTAFTEKQENDYSALTVWYVYDHPVTRQRRIVLVDAWQKRLELHGVHQPRLADESEATYLRRVSGKWGLIEWVTFTCTKRKVDRLLVENTARGHDVVKEIQRLYGDRTWGVVPINPRGGDKVARVHSIVDLFTDGMIFAPATVDEDGNTQFRDWAKLVMDNASAFPRGAHDDLVDSLSQAMRHLRDIGLAIRKEEKIRADQEEAMYRPPSSPLYPA